MDIAKFLTALPIMGSGMLGVFAVIALIILTVVVLNKTTSDKGN